MIDVWTSFWCRLTKNNSIQILLSISSQILFPVPEPQPQQIHRLFIHHHILFQPSKINITLTDISKNFILTDFTPTLLRVFHEFSEKSLSVRSALTTELNRHLFDIFYFALITRFKMIDTFWGFAKSTAYFHRNIDLLAKWFGKYFHDFDGLTRLKVFFFCPRNYKFDQVWNM